MATEKNRLGRYRWQTQPRPYPVSRTQETCSFVAIALSNGKERKPCRGLWLCCSSHRRLYCHHRCRQICQINRHWFRLPQIRMNIGPDIKKLELRLAENVGKLLLRSSYRRSC